MGEILEELSFSEWPDPPGSHPWLPAYGFQPPQDHSLEKEDFLDPADAALFLGGGISGPGSGGTFLETILEETSEELRSEGESPRPPCWLDDSDADSVIHVPHLLGKDDFDSGSERDFLCPAKRRKPNHRTDCPSPSDTTSLSLSLSRSSSLAQFESLEQSCQLLEASAPPSPLSLLSLDSLEKVKIQAEPEISPDSLENSSDSEPNSTSSQESTYIKKPFKQPILESHFNDKTLTDEKLDDATFVVSNGNTNDNRFNSNYFDCDEETKFWSINGDGNNEESGSSEFSDGRSSDSDRTVHENVNHSKDHQQLPHKYNFKSCRSLDALPSFESLDISRGDNIYTHGPSTKRNIHKQNNGQYSVENLSEDSGYSEHFCNFLRIKSKSIPNVCHSDKNAQTTNKTLKRKSEDNLFTLFKVKRKSEIVGQFGAKGKFHPKSSSPDTTVVFRDMSSKQKCDKKSVNGKRGTDVTEIAGVSIAPAATASQMRSAHSSPDIRRTTLFTDFNLYLDPSKARNTFPRSVASKLAHLIDVELENCPDPDANLYSVSSVPKDLNLCDVQLSDGHPSLDDNWSFGSGSVATKNFDLCDFAYPKKAHKVHEASFKQSFRVCESFTTSVADLTVLDYRSESDNCAKNIFKGLIKRDKYPKMSRNNHQQQQPTRERSAESDSTTESERVFLYEMEKTMRELNEQSRKILASTFDNMEFDRNLSILTNRRLNELHNPFDEVIAELELKQARSRAKSDNKKKEETNSNAVGYEFDFRGDEPDPPYYRRHFENTEDSSPDVSEGFVHDEMFFHSTPVKGGDKVQSTPNLNLFNKESADLYNKVAAKEELRSSMQHVPLKNDFKPVGILGSKSQGLSGSGSSKGVHFCPVVAEVSWRERSYSEDSTGIASSTSSGYSCGSEEVAECAERALSVSNCEAEHTCPPVPRSPPTGVSRPPPRRPVHPPPPTPREVAQAHTMPAPDVVDPIVDAATPITPIHSDNNNINGVTGDKPTPSGEKPTLPPKPPRSRIGGFLSRFANFRFSARKSNHAKKKSDGQTVANGRQNDTAVHHQHQQQQQQDDDRHDHRGDRFVPDRREPLKTGGETKESTPEYIYIPLKVKPCEGRPPLPPGRAGRTAPSPAQGAQPPPAGLLETDLDTHTTRTLQPTARARSLLALPPPPPDTRTHKSMEYLLDKDNLRCVEPPENDLQKNSADRVLSEHQLRVQRSLQKLNLPDWYKNSPVRPEGFLLKKRASDAGTGNRGWESPGLGSKTTSLGSLGSGVPLARSPLAPTSPSQQLGFSRWSTSRLNSAQTSPCSSARSSIRGGTVSPLTSPARPPRTSRPTRAPYLGWRSQERLASPRTPHERLAVSLLPQSPPVPANVSDEIQSSIKEVTSAIVHYVSGLEPNQDRLNAESDRSTSPRGSPRLCWLESSFVGTKPLESPQTPIVVTQLSPPHQPQHQQRPLQLDLPPSRPAANGTVTHSTTTYQHDWETSQHSLLNLAITKPSPGSTTLEDVLDSLLGLPPSIPRIASPQNSPRRAPSPYYMLGFQPHTNHNQTSTFKPNPIIVENRAIIESQTSNEETHNSTSIDISQDGDLLNRRRSSAESSSCSTLAPGMDGDDKDEGSMMSLPRIRARAKSAASGKHSSRRQSEPATAQKSHSLDRRTSYDSRIAKGDNNLSKTSLSDTPHSRTSLKSITSINTDGSAEDTLVHCRYNKCTSATTQADARRYYKNCHNCNYVYCSRECRRAHWEKHRKVCLHSRASTLCRQILSTAKEDADSLHHISVIAQRGYLSQGRGVVKVFFTSPDAAEKFTINGFQSLGEPIYVKWPDLMPNEMGPELYAELVKLCKSYNPETRLVLYVAVCIVSEVPTKGAAVKWERQIVSRCAKLRLSKTVLSNSSHSQFSTYSSPKAKIRNKDKQQKDKDSASKTSSTETLILTSNSANLHQKNNTTIQKMREVSFNNIQMQLQKRGVNLKKHYPEVHSKLCSYVEGTCDKFTPITIYPRDNTTGKLFMCVIMPETEPDKFQTLPNDSFECHTIDVSIDHAEQLSTPM